MALVRGKWIKSVDQTHQVYLAGGKLVQQKRIRKVVLQKKQLVAENYKKVAAGILNLFKRQLLSIIMNMTKMQILPKNRK